MNRYNIYLAGGISKFGRENFDEGNDWRIYIKKKLESIDCDYKVHCINPNDYHSFLNNNTYDSQGEIMEFDLDKVRKSDLIILNFNDINSLGTMAEQTVAYERRTPVIGLCKESDKDKLHPWQIKMSHKIFNNIYDLIIYVIDYYLN